MKYCQGPECHTYKTKDRIRGPKGAKYYQTRRASSFNYMGGNACTYRCQDDWFAKFGEQAVNHFGRIHEPIKLTVENAWYKDNDYDWESSTHSNWRFVNKLTNEVRPITKAQYDDDNFTLNT
tara:strand:+ start:823 stop:1188 length:366 start_codon:yes stop_codon:yes gene_type:complete